MICWHGVSEYMMLGCLLNIVQGWEETVVKQDQPNESQSEMKISLPSMPSLYITSFLFRACEEIHRVGGHVLDKPILQKFASRLLEKACKLLGHLILLNILYTLPKCFFFSFNFLITCCI